MAPQFQARLDALGQHPLVGEARGMGLVGAVELVADKAAKRSFEAKAGVGPRAVAFAQEEGLIRAIPAGRRVVALSAADYFAGGDSTSCSIGSAARLTARSIG